MKPQLFVLNMNTTPNESVFREDLESAFAESHEVTFIDTSLCLIDANTDAVKVFYNGGPLDLENAVVFVRSRKADSAFVGLLCGLLELKGVRFNDKANTYHSDYANKSFSIVRLAEKGLPVPRTMVCSIEGLKNNISHLESSISYPLVIKGDGSRGANVFLVENQNELLETAEKITSEKKTLLSIQEMVPNSYDVRALFMGSKFIAAIKRIAPEGAFHNNVSLGGSMAPDELSEEEITLCQRAIAVSNIDFCGVDFIRRESGEICFLEINKAPQLGGIRTVHPNLSVGEAFRDFIQGNL